MKFNAPAVAETNPLGLNCSVVFALRVVAEPENGTEVPTFV